MDLTDIVRVWRGNASSGWDPYSINMATPQIIIGAQTLHATGYAMGIQNDGADSVAVTYFGDGATSEGDVNEAMVFAASFQSPVIFFCQNNHWAISEPVRLQSHIQLADRAAGFGIPSVRVDGNDVLAVMAATRDGPGPGPPRRRPHLHRGSHLPDGPAYHGGRPHPLPRRQRTRGLGRARTRSPG